MCNLRPYQLGTGSSLAMWKSVISPPAVPASPKLASAGMSRRNHYPNDGTFRCGVSAQRDRLSAFLASCVEVDSLNADLVQPRWSGMDRCLQAALRNIPQLANGQPLPSSFGLNRRRQSKSPVKVLLNQPETCVAVPPRLSGTAGRT